jgi:hypothetical protein
MLYHTNYKNPKYYTIQITKPNMLYHKNYKNQNAVTCKLQKTTEEHRERKKSNIRDRSK